MRRPGRIRGALAAALLALGPGPALSCGFEDPNSAAFQRGMLNFAFPRALWVQTAVWQAQAAGLLEADTSLKGNRALLGFRRASDALSTLARDLHEADATVPDFTLVMIGPVLWTRFAADGGSIRATPHMKGPTKGDVVVVSDEPVVLALSRGRIAGSTALDEGLIRLYGDAAQVAVIESALRRIGG